MSDTLTKTPYSALLELQAELARVIAERDEAVDLLKSLAGGPDAQLWIVIRTKARAFLARIGKGAA